MKCLNCQFENQPSANFCSNCGYKLELTCHNCGELVSPEDQFCSNCGAELQLASEHVQAPTTKEKTHLLSHTPNHLAEKILRERSSLEGERRTVTVLYADAVGFTPISEKLDAEIAYKLIKGGVAHMMDAVHQYEGTITQFRGDGVMALFGAPIAHEDSARRAVAAALEMQESLASYAQQIDQDHQVELRFRVGLHTGRVVVGKVHDNLEMDYTAHGDTANFAARMETAAQPGTVYASESTFQAVKDYFEFESLGEIEVKGRQEPVPVYKALLQKPLRTRLEVAREHGLTPYVGRNHELNTLRKFLSRVQKDQGQVVFISGEAGIGKSRLLLEFRLSLESDEATWLEGHCISFGKNIPYLPIIDLLKNSFQIEETHTEDQIIKKIEEKTAHWNPQALETVPNLKFLLNVDPGDPSLMKLDPKIRREGIFDGLRALLHQECRDKPMIVVIEDLHWMDEQSEAALYALLDVVASTPVLLIVSYRPGYRHALGDRPFYTRIVLSELLPDETVEVAKGALENAKLPAELMDLIISKGEGNPFYVEEVAKSLVEEGVVERRNGSYSLVKPLDQIRVPDTIQEVILTRIDRLELEAKEALQLASVIGREFTVRLLDRISDLESELEGALGELRSLELIFQKAYFPELSYMFKHALTHVVAYASLLREKRRVLHRIIGVAIEDLYQDRITEHYEVRFKDNGDPYLYYHSQIRMAYECDWALAHGWQRQLCEGDETLFTVKFVNEAGDPVSISGELRVDSYHLHISDSHMVIDDQEQVSFFIRGDRPCHTSVELHLYPASHLFHRLDRGGNEGRPFVRERIRVNVASCGTYRKYADKPYYDLTASPATLPADNTSTTTLTVVRRHANGIADTSSNETVLLGTTRGRLSADSIQLVDGVGTFTLRSIGLAASKYFTDSAPRL